MIESNLTIMLNPILLTHINVSFSVTFLHKIPHISHLSLVNSLPRLTVGSQGHQDLHISQPPPRRCKQFFLNIASVASSGIVHKKKRLAQTRAAKRNWMTNHSPCCSAFDELIHAYINMYVVNNSVCCKTNDKT